MEHSSIYVSLNINCGISKRFEEIQLCLSFIQVQESKILEIPTIKI